MQSLTDHLNRTLVNELLGDITHGVHIGFQDQRRKHISDDHQSANSNPEAVARELEREISLKHKIGPFLVRPFENFVGSPMGAIPKKTWNSSQVEGNFSFGAKLSDEYTEKAGTSCFVSKSGRH